MAFLAFSHKDKVAKLVFSVMVMERAIISMCGRFGLAASISEINQVYGVNGRAAIPQRYNIAPTQPVLTVRLDEKCLRELVATQWGLVPSWAKELRKDKPLINARSETIAVKPSFKGSFKRRRAIVPATFWYEWKSVRGYKQPYVVESAEGGLFGFAAIWDVWNGVGGESWLETMAIVTAPTTGALRPLHHRRPLVLAAHDYDAWLEPHDPMPKDFIESFNWVPENAFHWCPVSKRVNNVGNDDKNLLGPPEQEPQGSLF